MGLCLLTHQMAPLVFQVETTMVEVYKNNEKCGKATVNFDLLIPLTSGHPMKLSGSKFKTNKRKYSFTKLVIKLRNSFPQDAMEANNIKEFRKGLDKFMEDMCTDSYQKQ